MIARVPTLPTPTTLRAMSMTWNISSRCRLSSSSVDRYSSNWSELNVRHIVEATPSIWQEPCRSDRAEERSRCGDRAISGVDHFTAAVPTSVMTVFSPARVGALLFRGVAVGTPGPLAPATTAAVHPATHCAPNNRATSNCPQPDRAQIATSDGTWSASQSWFTFEV